MAGAFQPGAFQAGAFQVPQVGPAFQSDAFQVGAFQEAGVVAVPPVTAIQPSGGSGDNSRARPRPYNDTVDIADLEEVFTAFLELKQAA